MTKRRAFIKQVGTLGVAGAMLPHLVDARDIASFDKSKRSLRIAHITDVHILDKELAKKSLARVLSEINNMKDRPDFIINTGDSVMDANEQVRDTVETEWKVWADTVNASNKLDMYSALGNHDVWYAPNAQLDAEYKLDKRYGKQWAIDVLKMPHRYYSFETRGWKFIALDSMNGDAGYQLGAEQMEWLTKELREVKSPVLIFNHVPILSMGAILYYTKRKPLNEVNFPLWDMHNDHQPIKDLFHNSKVKLCLSGHIHYIDGINYLGINYLCNGAVSGNWWGDPIALDEFPPVYSIIDLYSDGSYKHQLVYYSTTV